MRALALAFAFLVAAGPAFAQPDPAAAGPEAAVRATVARLFDGMRARDTALVASAFHPEARLQTVVRDDATHRLEATPLDGFLAALAASPVGWDERLGDVDVRLDDGLAMVWAEYRFFVEDRFIHCGVNAFTLVLGPSGWRIVQIVDTRRTDCD